jgi:hypothetical protein
MKPGCSSLLSQILQYLFGIFAEGGLLHFSFTLPALLLIITSKISEPQRYTRAQILCPLYLAEQAFFLCVVPEKLLVVNP